LTARICSRVTSVGPAGGVAPARSQSPWKATRYRRLRVRYPSLCSLSSLNHSTYSSAFSVHHRAVVGTVSSKSTREALVLKDPPQAPTPSKVWNGDPEDSDRPDALEGSTSALACAIPVATRLALWSLPYQAT
jgi:hypothetical protein